jgi:hypothetical protein
LVADDLEVSFHNSDYSIIKKARVISVDNSNKVFTVKFGGAPSDTYYPSISHHTYGEIAVGTLTITTEGYVSSIHLNSASHPVSSVYGGALLTITGKTFSNDPLDNNVKIGTTDCIVQTSSPTQITCRTVAKADLFAEK